MNTQAVPYNILSYTAALAEGLSYGDRIHLRVRGNHVTEDAFLFKLHEHKGIIIVMDSVNGRRINEPLLWGDIIELWPLEEKPDIYHSDVPEVVGILKKLKDGIQKCVEADNGPGVLYLLDQVSEAKKAELLFKEDRAKEARKIIAAVRL